MVCTELKVLEFSALGIPISKQRISDKKKNDERPGGSREKKEVVDFFGFQ